MDKCLDHSLKVFLRARDKLEMSQGIVVQYQTELADGQRFFLGRAGSEKHCDKKKVIEYLAIRS